MCKNCRKYTKYRNQITPVNNFAILSERTDKGKQIKAAYILFV